VTDATITFGMSLAPDPVGATGTIGDFDFGIGAVVTITVREVGAWYRNTVQGVLYLVWGFGRTRAVGFRAADGWERVSTKFRFNGTDEGRSHATSAVAATWTAHSGDDQATLTGHLDTALQSAGYRRNDGSDIA
jgi:hypothetical protein